MSKEHHYNTKIIWTGNQGFGTIDAGAYQRSHTLFIEHKVDILCSSDTPFRGDASKHNPEDALVYALSSCHMLWYLHLCADNGIVVLSYEDNAQGIMTENIGGGGQFKEVTLHPKVQITDASKIEIANALHDQAHQKCFIANSCNFPVHHQPICSAI